MKNFPITDTKTGKEYWISRSIAVVVILFAKDTNGKEYVLTIQRGKGTPDPEFIGKYCLPCGYLDFDETCISAAQRELKEETGITIPTTSFTLLDINDRPNEDKRQNITFRYLVEASQTVKELESMFTTKNAEKDEIESIKFISLDELNNYEWAFNHNNLIEQYI